MSTKKLIIILVFIGLIIGIVMWNNKKNIGNGDGSNTNNGYDDLYNGGGNSNGSGSGSGSGTRDQNSRSYSDSWYTDIAKALYVLFDGFTSDAEEAEIIRLIARCKTRQDVLLLETAYNKVDPKYDFKYRIEDDIKDGGSLSELNSALRANGCDYYFSF